LAFGATFFGYSNLKQHLRFRATFLQIAGLLYKSIKSSIILAKKLKDLINDNIKNIF
jgi:hypothetical protein